MVVLACLIQSQLLGGILQMSRNILENTTQLNEFLFSNPLPYKNWKLNQKIFHRYCLPFLKNCLLFHPKTVKTSQFYIKTCRNHQICYVLDIDILIFLKLNMLRTWHKCLNFSELLCPFIFVQVSSIIPEDFRENIRILILFFLNNLSDKKTKIGSELSTD